MGASNMQPVFRFAPSPNGWLHLGHAYSALLNFEAAQRSSGQFLLRIENIDPARSRQKFELAIFDDLAWLGLEWPKPVRRQSEHFDEYRSALQRLAGQGLAYPCFCSRSDIALAVQGRRNWRRDPDGAPLYPGTCRHLDAAQIAASRASGKAAAQRLDMARALAQSSPALAWREFGLGDVARKIRATPELWGDVVIGRKDVPTSYHLAVVVDDALQGVSDVMRGADLFEATALHRLLQDALGLAAPNYHHHPLVLNAQGQKLSKSRHAPALSALRAEGAGPGDIRALLAQALPTPSSHSHSGVEITDNPVDSAIVPDDKATPIL